MGALILALMVSNTNLRLTSTYVKDTQRGVSRLEIKTRKAEEKQRALEKQMADFEKGSKNNDLGAGDIA